MVDEEMAEHTPGSMRAAKLCALHCGCGDLEETAALIAMLVQIINSETNLPELLAQRDDLLEACKNLVRGQLQHPTFEGYVECAVELARAAIKKAQGATP